MSAPTTPEPKSATARKKDFDNVVRFGAETLGRVINATLREGNVLTKQKCHRIAGMQQLVAASTLEMRAAAEYVDDEKLRTETADAMEKVFAHAKQAGLSKRDLGRLGSAVCRSMGSLGVETSEYYRTLVESKAELQRESVFADAEVDRKVQGMEGMWDRAQMSKIALAQRTAKVKLLEAWEKTPVDKPADEEERNAAMRTVSMEANASVKRQLAAAALAAEQQGVSKETHTERISRVMKRAKISDEWCFPRDEEEGGALSNE